LRSSGPQIAHSQVAQLNGYADILTLNGEIQAPKCNRHLTAIRGPSRVESSGVAVDAHRKNPQRQSSWWGRETRSGHGEGNGSARDQRALGTDHHCGGYPRSKPVDTSKRMTPLEGVVMGTRSDDPQSPRRQFDRNEGKVFPPRSRQAPQQPVWAARSFGSSNDMRALCDELHEYDNRRVPLAIEIFCWRARKYMGAYLACMNGADTVIFTSGIGETCRSPRQGFLAPSSKRA
jgi:Acetokinase family